MVKTVPFGTSGIEIAQPGFGAMGLSFGIGNPLTQEQAEPLLLRAVELGCTFWDTAVRFHIRSRTDKRLTRSSMLLVSMRSY